MLLRVNRATHDQGEKGSGTHAGQNRSWLEDRPDPLPPRRPQGQFVPKVVLRARSAGLDSPDDLAGKVIEVAGGRLLVAFEFEQPAERLEVWLICIHVQFK